MTRPRFIPLLHVGYWSLYVLLLAFLFAVLRTQSHAAPATTRVALLLVAPDVAAFYLAYLVLFPRFAARGRVAALAVAGGVAALVIAGGAYALVRAIWPLQLATADWRAGLLLLAGLATIHMGIAIVLRGFVGWIDDLAIKAELTRKQQDIEAALVRSKLDPHFLFNTLNNLDVLVTRDPAAASRYLQALADLLRFVLYEAAVERIPLEAELRYVEKYVALQRLRHAEAGFVRLEVSGDARGICVAPMLIIPFIENAFKHVAGERGDGAITIRVAIDGERVTFVCSNRYAPRAAAAPSGLGNALMRRRLALLYPERHTLDVADHDGRFAVTMTVDTAA